MEITLSREKARSHEFYITVLGRTLEHLGAQMYKRRETAIAELIANCWDAGAGNVFVDLPEKDSYNKDKSRITILDDGFGMNPKTVEEEYLIVGRNRRKYGDDRVGDRPIIGRKGIGKLAGFGIASRITVYTWRDAETTEFTLDLEELKLDDRKAGDVGIGGKIYGSVPSDNPQGTLITLERLKHKTPPDIDKVRFALARRFSRYVKGRMKIYVNDVELKEPDLNVIHRYPEDGFAEAELEDGYKVKYFYAFSKKPIPTKELRGFVIYARGKTVQAPPFFFNVEGTASGQHATRYVTGEIEADFIDSGTDDESDIISTDRQEIDWDEELITGLLKWGERLSRDVLIECIEFRGKDFTNWILKDDIIRRRIVRLDKPSQNQITRFLNILGKIQDESPRAKELAGALVGAYEFRQFHDVIKDIEEIGDDAEKLTQLLEHLYEWRVLESRAILEIVKGRLDIVDKFHKMIQTDTPETAAKIGMDNLHDLLARFPWLLNPEWQVLAEEKSLTKQLREWNEEDISDEDARMRYDFLALTGEGKYVVIEIKRPGHALELDDLSRLDKYRTGFYPCPLL